MMNDFLSLYRELSLKTVLIQRYEVNDVWFDAYF